MLDSTVMNRSIITIPSDLEVNYIQDVQIKWSLNIVTAGCCVNTNLALNTGQQTYSIAFRVNSQIIAGRKSVAIVCLHPNRF